MLMNKLLSLFILVVVLLTACSDPNGPSYYPFGLVWETDGNSASVTSAEIVDIFEAADGQCYAAQSDQRLLLVHCDLKLSLGWQIRKDTYVSKTGKQYALRWIVVQDNAQGNQEYILLFVLDTEDCADGNVESLELELEIESADGSARRTQSFVLRN